MFSVLRSVCVSSQLAWGAARRSARTCQAGRAAVRQQEREQIATFTPRLDEHSQSLAAERCAHQTLKVFVGRKKILENKEEL